MICGESRKNNVDGDMLKQKRIFRAKSPMIRASSVANPHVLYMRNAHRLGDCVPVGYEVLNAYPKNTRGNRCENSRP